MRSTTRSPRHQGLAPRTLALAAAATRPALASVPRDADAEDPRARRGALEVPGITFSLDHVELVAGRGAPDGAGSSAAFPAASGLPVASAGARTGAPGGPLAGPSG